MAVVDPGVGSARAPLAAESGGRYFVGPDNGVLSLALGRGARVHRIENDALCLPNRSRTFHGRDVFAPVAAHLAAGVELEQVGPRVRSWTRSSAPKARRTRAGLVGHVVLVDRYGNLVTSIREHELPAPFEVQAGSFATKRLVNSYAEAKAGEPLAIVGSYGHLEIAVREGSASNLLGLGVGSVVRVLSRGRG